MLQRKARGSITVFLSLSIVIIITFLFALFQSALINTRKNECRLCANSAIDSMFSEYDKNLLDNYGLLFLDGSYKEQYLEENLKERFKHFACYTNDDNFAGTPSVESLEIEGIRFINDDGCNEYITQATKYVLSMYGKDFIDDALKDRNIFSYITNSENEWSIHEKNNKKDLEDLEKDKSNSGVQVDGEVEKNNPLNEILNIKKYDILNIVMPNKNISDKVINTSDLPSNRKMRTGYGNAIKSTSSEALDKLMFGKYLLSKFNNALNIKNPDTMLNYEIEYMIYGSSSDRENLKGVVNKLLLMREGINFSYLLLDASKNAEALALATTLVGYFCIPPLITATKYALLLAWAYAESIIDIKELLKGNKIPLLKTSYSWQLSLANLKTLSYETKQNDKGLTYEDFLMILIELKETSGVARKSLDLIENNIRKVEGEEEFRIDNLVSSISFKSRWSILNYSYSFPISYKYN